MPWLLLPILAICFQAGGFASEDNTSASLLKLPSLAGIVSSSDAGATSPSVEKASRISLDAASDQDETSGPLFSVAPVYWGSVGSRGGLSVKRVMDLAWQANPNWQKYVANHAAAHAALLEACALPNPEVEGEIGRERSRAGEGSRGIWSLGFSQPIELPGKRRARQAEALAGFPVAEREASEFANSLKADVREAYWTVQYNVALEQMHQGQVTITKQQYTLAEKRIELGDAGKMELLNARVEMLKAQREFETARRRRLGSMAALNALCGGALGRSYKLAADFPHDYARPSLDSAVRAALSAHPRLAVLAAQLEQKYAGIERQRREWWPDIKVGARHSREFDSDSNALTASVEIPLWNRNEGGIAQAQADAQKVYAEIGIAYNELRRDVEMAYQTLMASREEISSYENGLRGAAEDAVRLAWEQLNLGGGGYVEILLARQQLIEIQRGYIQALYEAATAQAAFDRAVGQ
jgi:cobalt-zinc-cadmium efflux system outer membrane protein